MADDTLKHEKNNGEMVQGVVSNELRYFFSNDILIYGVVSTTFLSWFCEAALRVLVLRSLLGCMTMHDK